MNQHYIEWLPGTVARVIDKPSIVPNQEAYRGDANVLSRVVTNFNDGRAYGLIKPSVAPTYLFNLFHKYAR